MKSLHDVPDMGNDVSESALALVRFFDALSPELRQAYEVLAERDRAFGENVAAELQALRERGETR